MSANRKQEQLAQDGAWIGLSNTGKLHIEV